MPTPIVPPSDENSSTPEPQPGYYAVVPAHVRYDQTIPPNAKLLYGEITALCNKEGYCWATNRYFADLYDVKVRAVQNWIAALFAAGHIYVDPVDTYKRRLWLSEAAYRTHAKKCTGPCRKVQGAVQNNAPHRAEICTNNIKSSTPKSKTKNTGGADRASKSWDTYANAAREGKALILSLEKGRAQKGAAKGKGAGA